MVFSRKLDKQQSLWRVVANPALFSRVKQSPRLLEIALPLKSAARNDTSFLEKAMDHLVDSRSELDIGVIMTGNKLLIGGFTRVSSLR